MAKAPAKKAKRPKRKATKSDDAREDDGKWKKGHSGNAGGMVKGYKEIRDLARELCPEAIHTLAARMRSKDERVSTAACIAILDRGIGKAPIAITGEDGGPIQVDYRNLSDTQLRQLREILADASVSSTA